MNLYKHGEIAVRELKPSDEQLLMKWLTDPELLQYYEGRDRPHDPEMVREHFYNEGGETRCIVLYKDQPIGYIHFYPVDKDAAQGLGYTNRVGQIYGTDQFIGEAGFWNQGIGRKLVTSMVGYLTEQKQAARIIMDPQAWNKRAITCYERCGFKKVKLLKEHELHEGWLRDCWLMEWSEEPNAEKEGEL